MKFSDLNLIQPLLDAVEASGYSEPTPIQLSTIPIVLSGRDVLGCAQTGTGKTAAFALPILQKLHQEPLNLQKGEKLPIRALILTPTRELALQIQESIETYGANIAIESVAIFGGVSQNPQVQKLKAGVDILVATPGRLNDLIGQGYIDLKKLGIFVLDEADRMLDMGFIHDVRRVIAQIPKKRQTLFFSATMPDEVEKLAMSILHDPETVKVDPPSSTVESIRQLVYLVDKVNKKKLLPWVINQPEVTSALVFTRTKHGADRVVRELAREGVQAMSIHGDKTQTARQEALSKFKAGDIKVLIATDIAARGIDIAELSHVINYELPDEAENYVHRIGRTGRAGLEGDAISFCCYDEFDALKAIEKLIGIDLPVVESPWPMEVFTSTKDPDSRELRDRRDPRGRGDRRGSSQGRGERRDGPRAERPARAEAPKAERPAKAEASKAEPVKTEAPRTERPVKAERARTEAPRAERVTPEQAQTPKAERPRQERQPRAARPERRERPENPVEAAIEAVKAAPKVEAPKSKAPRKDRPAPERLADVRAAQAAQTAAEAAQPAKEKRGWWHRRSKKSDK